MIVSQVPYELNLTMNHERVSESTCMYLIDSHRDDWWQPFIVLYAVVQGHHVVDAKFCCAMRLPQSGGTMSQNRQLHKGSSEEASLRIVRQKMQAAKACCLLAALNMFHCERHVARHGLVIGFDLLVLVLF